MKKEKICVDLITGVLSALQNECKQHEYCSEKNCRLYNREEATCFLRAYPCDYDLQEIEKRIIEIIEDKLKDGEKK